MSEQPSSAERWNRPVLFVTTEIPPDRVGAFRALTERGPVEFALFGGGLHATSGVDDHGLPVHQVSQREVYGLAASGRYAAVIAGTVGRTALPAAWLGAERARVPFLLWTALWAHPRSLAHLPGSLLLRMLYRRADAVVTYGPHVSALARRLGARNPVVAPQAVDVDFWAARQDLGPRGVGTTPTILYVGRDDPGKGVDWLLRSWKASGLGVSGDAELRLVGPSPARADGLQGVSATGPLDPAAVREEMARASAVVVPSERTVTFREPWGLVVNEAMHSGTLVIASTQVGAVAGGLAVPGWTALVTTAGDVNGLSTMLCAAAGPETAQLQAIRRNAAQAVVAYTHESWAETFASALEGSLA